MNRALIALGCLVVVLVAGALIAPSFIDWNKYKDSIQAEAQRLTGRDVTVGGSLSFAVLPSPHLSAEDVRIANIPGAKAPDFARLKSLRVRVAFLPLLTGQVQVRQITLVEPKIALEIIADGTRNWVIASDQNAPEKQNGSPRLLQAVRLDNFVIENGDITFRDERAGESATEESVQGLNAVITAETLQGPVKASGQATFRTVPIGFTLSAGQYSPGQPMAVSLQLHAADEPVQASFDGVVTDTAPHASVNGKLSLGGDDLSGFIRIIRTASQATATDAPAFASHKPFSYESKVSGTIDQAKLDDIALSIGDAQGSGAATLSLAAGPKFDVALQVNSIDLDAFLKPGPKPQHNTSGPTVVDIGPSAPAGFALPTEANGSLDLGVAAMSYHGGTVRQIHVAADLKDGRISITRAAALLPGGSDISGTGTLSAAAGKPQFDGMIKGTSNNVRAILDWFDVNPAEIPADRLTKLVFASGLQVQGDTAHFSDLDLTLDTSHIGGTAAVAFQARPKVDLDVDVDRLNFDAYVGGEPDVAPPAAASSDTAKPAQAAPPAAGEAAKPASPDRPFAMFDGFDGSLKARIGHVTWFGVSGDNVAIEGLLDKGIATLASLTADDVAGAHIRATGSARGFSGDVAYKTDLDLSTDELADFVRAVDISVPFAKDSLGKAVLKLGIDDNAGTRTIDVTGKIGETAVAVARERIKSADGNQFNVRFDLKNPSLKTFARQFSIGFMPATGSTDTPVALNGTVSGTDAAAKLKLHGAVTGGTVDATGDLASLARNTSYNLAVSVAHDDFTALASELGFDYSETQGAVGAVAVSAQVKGDAGKAELSDVKATLGETTASGNARIDVSGAVPKITASLIAGKIMADRFLAKPTTGVEQAKEAGRIDPGMRRWSRSRLGLDWLTHYAGDIELRANSLAVRGYDFQNADIKLLLDNGTLTVRQFAGQLFGGALDMRAVLRGQATPDLSVTFSLANASVDAALAKMAGLNTATGTFSINGSVSATGSSQFDLISDMTGSATIKAQNGVLRGIDLKRIATGAAKIATMDDVAKLLSTATSQGTTPYKSIQATLRLDNGILTAQNIAADIDSATAVMDASVDLPHWSATVNSRFKIKGLAADAPPIGIDLTGALNKPQRNVQTADMRQYLGRNVNEALLKGVIEQDNKGLNELLGSNKAPAPKDAAGKPPPAPEPAAPKASQ